jgi:hypothetical protein
MAKLGLERLDGDEAERIEIGWLFWSMSFVWEQRLRDLRTIVTDEIHQIKLLSRNASCCRRQSTSWHFPEHNTNTTIEFVFQRLPKWLLLVTCHPRATISKIYQVSMRNMMGACCGSCTDVATAVLEV